MEYEKRGKIKKMLDTVNKKPKKVVAKKETTKKTPTTNVKKMVEIAGTTKTTMRKGILDRTTKDMIKQNIQKILPKGSSKAFEAKVKKAYMEKFDTYKIKKGKTEAEHLMNVGRVALQTRNFIEKQIKSGMI
jgi:hypothetical protein